MFENDYIKSKKLFNTIGILLLTGLILSLLKCTISKSAKVTEEQLYTAFYEGAKQISTDDVQRKAVADCLLSKVKVKYEGHFEDLDLKKDKKLIDSITTECAQTITKLSWTPEIEQKMLAKFSSMEELNGATTEKKDAYAKCILLKLKTKYPKGLNGRIAQKEMDEIYVSCLAVLK